MQLDRLQGSIVALVTPFLEDGHIDESSFIALIRHHSTHKTQGLVVGGTTGEGALLSDDEFFHLVHVAVREAGPYMTVIANTGTCSTYETIARTQRAQDMGVHACMVITPYYVKPSQDGLLAHFEAVHDATNVPIILYNVPSRTGVDLKPETVAKLACKPRIVALKDATADVTRLIPGIIHLSGDDATNLDHMCHGGVGAISVTANVAPCELARFYAHKELHLHKQLMPLHQALFCTTNPAPVKYALSLLGLCGPTTRLPLVPLSEAEKSIVHQALSKTLSLCY